jgi:hypothetical protein
LIISVGVEREPSAEADRGPVGPLRLSSALCVTREVNSMKLLYLVILIALISCVSNSYAWDGYDYESGSYVEIEKGNLVREGEEIEYYDYESGEYRTGDVESIESSGSGAEVEIYDHDSGEYRTFDMD